MPTPFPLVDVQGSPYERGRQHGSAVPEHVARSVALYRGQLERRGVDAARLKELAAAMVPVVGDYDAAYLEELRGIADGAGQSLEDVVVINCRTEMMFGHAELGRARKGLDDGCTGLVVLPEASAEGKLMHAHNWDWREECVDTGIVVRMRREDGPDLLMFTEAGSLARHGFNSAGVSLSGNFLSCEQDYQRPAQVPLVLVRRKMLEATNICNAMKVLWASRRFCSNNLMLAQAQGEAVDLECAPDEIFWITPQDGLLVHANHWISPRAPSCSTRAWPPTPIPSIASDASRTCLRARAARSVGMPSSASWPMNSPRPTACCVRPSRPASTAFRPPWPPR